MSRGHITPGHTRYGAHVRGCGVGGAHAPDNNVIATFATVSKKRRYHGRAECPSRSRSTFQLGFILGRQVSRNGFPHRRRDDPFQSVVPLRPDESVLPPLTASPLSPFFIGFPTDYLQKLLIRHHPCFWANQCAGFHHRNGTHSIAPGLMPHGSSIHFQTFIISLLLVCFIHDLSIP